MKCWLCKEDLVLLDRGKVIKCPNCNMRWTHSSVKAKPIVGYDTKFKIHKYKGINHD